MKWFRSHFYIVFQAIVPAFLVLLGIVASLVNTP